MQIQELKTWHRDVVSLYRAEGRKESVYMIVQLLEKKEGA